MTNRTELTAERIERAIAIQKELIRDMRSDEVDKDNRETAEEVAEIVETVVIPALRAEQEREHLAAYAAATRSNANGLTSARDMQRERRRHAMLRYYLRCIRWMWQHRDEKDCRQKWRRMERQVRREG